MRCIQHSASHLSSLSGHALKLIKKVSGLFCLAVGILLELTEEHDHLLLTCLFCILNIGSASLCRLQGVIQHAHQVIIDIACRGLLTFLHMLSFPFWAT